MTTKGPEWAFITRHGLVLTYIAKQPRATVRQIATALNMTERTVHRTITELEKEDYIERQRVGRNNVYRINSNLHLRHHTIRNVIVGDLLKALGWRRRRKHVSGVRATR